MCLYLKLSLVRLVCHVSHGFLLARSLQQPPASSTPEASSEGTNSTQSVELPGLQVVDTEDENFGDDENVANSSYEQLRSSVFSELEELRARLEDALGMDNFIEAYRYGFMSR